MIKTYLLLAAMLICSTALAQITSDTKDYQTAKKRLYLGTDTSAYFTEIKKTITSPGAHKHIPTVKAVYDFLQSYYIVATTSATDAAKVKLNNDASNGVILQGQDGITLDPVTSAQINIALKDTSVLAGKIAPSGASTGDVLTWTGAAWEPSSPTNPYVFVNSSSTLTTAYNTVLIGNLTAAVTLGLPTCNAGSDGKQFVFQKGGDDSFQVTIDPAGSEPFSDGTSSKVIFSTGTGLHCTCRFSSGTGKWFFTNM